MQQINNANTPMGCTEKNSTSFLWYPSKGIIKECSILNTKETTHNPELGSRPIKDAIRTTSKI